MNTIPPHRAAPRERPWSKRESKPGDWDALVIGSGMGGMVAAGLLAAVGQRVLVLEQHYVPGGFTHKFRRHGYAWDVGVHAVGIAGLRGLPGRVLDLLSGGDLRWTPLGGVYDEVHLPGGFQFSVPDSPQVLSASLKVRFPESPDAIDAWFAALAHTSRRLTLWHLSHLIPGAAGRWLSGRLAGPLLETIEARLAELVPDERLRAVLSAQWGYHGERPSRGAWALQTMITNHFLHGASYPVGGSSQIATTLLRGVAAAGGWTRICADVAEIVLEDGRAVGVRMADGEVLRARTIISDTGAWNTASRLLPPDARAAPWAESLRELQPSAAHVCLYIGFKGDIAAAGASRRSEWDFQTWSHEEGLWDPSPDQPVPPPPLTFTSFPSLKDPSHVPGPTSKHTGEVIAFVPWSTFQRWQGPDGAPRSAAYEDFKRSLGQRLLASLLERHPRLGPLVDYWEVSTPLSTDHFSRANRGAMYGLAGTPARFANPWLRPQTPIPGLYLTGADVGACGVTGALMGGVLCALSVAPLRVSPLLVRTALRRAALTPAT
jgi:all-trans-retinol 13,14-reductase